VPAPSERRRDVVSCNSTMTHGNARRSAPENETKPEPLCGPTDAVSIRAENLPRRWVIPDAGQMYKGQVINGLALLNMNAEALVPSFILTAGKICEVQLESRTRATRC
jgi:hypothetical protein